MAGRGRAGLGAESRGHVLSVASECVPLVKTGGLADVVGALPGALAGQGWRMRVLLPAYPGLAARLDAATEVWRADDLFGGPGRVLAGRGRRDRGAGAGGRRISMTVRAGSMATAGATSTTIPNASRR